MDETLIFNVTHCEEGYNVQIPAGTRGESVMQALAVLVHELGNKQRETDRGYSDATVLKGVEIWLRLIKEEQ